jgi:hypothetical protein
MKLAEALLERKELKNKIEQLRARAAQNALIQEGDAPAENPVELLCELDGVVEAWSNLIRRINATNNRATLGDGTTLSDAIVRRDALDQRRIALDTVLNQATVRQDRYGRNEIKFVTTVDVVSLRSETDRVSKQRRELDAQIQALNWNVDLVEL